MGEENDPRIIAHILRHLSGNKMPEIAMCNTCWDKKGHNLAYQAGGWHINRTVKPINKPRTRRAYRIK